MSSNPTALETSSPSAAKLEQGNTQLPAFHPPVSTKPLLTTTAGTIGDRCFLRACAANVVYLGHIMKSSQHESHALCVQAIDANLDAARKFLSQRGYDHSSLHYWLQEVTQPTRRDEY